MWLFVRHGGALPAPYRLAVVLGLIVTFVAGTGAGMAISVHGGSTIGAVAGGATLPLMALSS